MCCLLELVPLRGEKNSSHACKTRSWYLSKDILNISDGCSCSFYMEVTPPPAPSPDLHITKRSILFFDPVL